MKTKHFALCILAATGISAFSLQPSAFSQLTTNIPVQPGIWGGPSTSYTSPPTNILNVTPEQYGGKGDLVALNDCTFTNGLANLYSPTASFKSTDVGKTCILYNRDANPGGTPNNYAYTNCTIAALVDSNDVTLSITIPDTETGSGMFRYGTDNTAAFQAIANLVALTNNAVNQTIQINCALNGWYLINGTCIQRWAQESSIIHFPVTGVQFTNQHPRIVFDGQTPSYLADTRQAGPSSWTGSGIYTGGYPTNTILLPLGNGCCVFGGCFNTNLNTSSDAANNFSTLNVIFKNLTFREAYAEYLTMMNFRWGGGLGIYNCGFDVDYPVGALAGWALGIDPYYTGNNNQSVAVYFPEEGNNAWNDFQNSWVFNYWGGVVGAENLKVQFSFITQCGGHALGLGQAPNDAAIFLTAVTLPFNQTNIFVDPNIPAAGVPQCEIMASGVNVIKSPNGNTKAFIVDPGTHIHVTGVLSLDGVPGYASMATNTVVLTYPHVTNGIVTWTINP